MRMILSKHDLRHLVLLEFLLKNKHQWISLKNISDRLNIPTRTLHADIHEINTYISPINIRTSPFGIKISIPSTYSERHLYKRILEVSREFYLIELIFTNEGETIESLSDKLYISQSTTKRMIRDINSVLAEEGFFILGKPLSFSGDERKLTQVMSLYFSEKYYFLDEFMTEEEQLLTTKLVTCIAKEMNKEINYPEFRRRATWLYLNCIRLRHGHHLPLSVVNKYQFNILYDKNFCDKFLNVFGVCLTEETINQLFYVITSGHYVSRTEELEQLLQVNLEQRTLFQDISAMLNNISADLNVSLTESRKEKLLINLLNLLNIRGNRIYLLYNRRNYFLSELSSRYIHVQDIIENYIKNNFSLQFHKSELNEFIYILLTHWPELYNRIRFIEPPIKVFLLIDSDVELGQLITEELEEYSHFNTVITVLSAYSKEVLSDLVEDSVLITNIPGIKNVNSHLLCIGEFMSRRDWEDFGTCIEDILRSDKSSLC